MTRKDVGNYLFLVVPQAVEHEHRRFYQVIAVIVVASFLGHLAFVPLFILLGVTPLALFNIGSTILFVCTLIINRHGYHYLAMVLMVAEYTCHAALAVHFVGWQFGFQYYVFGWALVPWFAPAGRRGIKLGVFLVGCLALAALYQYAVARPTPIGWDARLIIGINVFNVVFLAAVLASAFVYFRVLVDAAEAELEREYGRSETLLRNMLPQVIAARLKEDPRGVADSFKDASVLFLDIVDFTPRAEGMPAASVVEMLNEVFTALDNLSERLNLEKIKTIGDAYMVAAGIPEPTFDHHHQMAEFALSVGPLFRGYRDQSGQPLTFRIGVHSGPLVAGVIGRTKYSYDLWGDAVNTAARMESSGVPGRIHCSSDFRGRVSDRFRFERRGIVEIKGKGPMPTFFLVGKREADVLS